MLPIEHGSTVALQRGGNAAPVIDQPEIPKKHTMNHDNGVPGGADLLILPLPVQRLLFRFEKDLPAYGANDAQQHNQIHHRNHAAKKPHHSLLDAKLHRCQIHAQDAVPEHRRFHNHADHCAPKEPFRFHRK